MIFYFTGTGNSLFTAKKLSEQTGDALTDIGEAIRTGKMNFHIKAGENIGFVFPVYYSGLPHIMAKFISESDITADESCYTFAVIPCGATSAGADSQLRTLLAKKDMHADYIAQLKTADNYVMLYDPADEEKAAAVTETAETALLNIAQDILLKKKGGFDSRTAGRIANAVMQPLYNMMRKTKKFYADDNCVSCGQCEKRCPVNIIRMTNGKPAWTAAKCEHCTACINRCPQRAIQYGGKTKNRTRFENKLLRGNGS